MAKGKSKAFLKALRKKYGLGEYKKGTKSSKRRRSSSSRSSTSRWRPYSKSAAQDQFLAEQDKLGIPGLGGGFNLPSPFSREKLAAALKK